MNAWNQDLYIRAWNYASIAHNGQLVPGTDIPYINHVGLVAMEAMSAIAWDNGIEKPDLLVVSALLHDTLEDTGRTYGDIEKEFGAETANGVSALTKNKNLPSQVERMNDSLNRIRMCPREIWMVKLCDRITNLQPPPGHWSHQKIESYRKEARTILERLGSASQYLSERLKTKIYAYCK